jgi:hypothetical protein
MRTHSKPSWTLFVALSGDHIIFFWYRFYANPTIQHTFVDGERSVSTLYQRRPRTVTDHSSKRRRSLSPSTYCVPEQKACTRVRSTGRRQNIFVEPPCFRVLRAFGHPYAHARLYNFSYHTLKDFVILFFRTLTVMSNAVKIVGILFRFHWRYILEF